MTAPGQSEYDRLSGGTRRLSCKIRKTMMTSCSQLSDRRLVITCPYAILLTLEYQKQRNHNQETTASAAQLTLFFRISKGCQENTLPKESTGQIESPSHRRFQASCEIVFCASAGLRGTDENATGRFLRPGDWIYETSLTVTGPWRSVAALKLGARHGTKGS